MSRYASRAEVREVAEATLRMEGRDPADYSISGIMADAFSYSAGYGWSAFGMEAEWRAAVERHRNELRAEPATCTVLDCAECGAKAGKPCEPWCIADQAVPAV